MNLSEKLEKNRYRSLTVLLPEPLFFRLKQLAVLERKPIRYYVTAGLRRVFREDDPLPVSPKPDRPPGSKLRRVRTYIPESLYSTLRYRALLDHIPLRFYVITGLKHVMGHYPSARDTLASICSMPAPRPPERVEMTDAASVLAQG